MDASPNNMYPMIDKAISVPLTDNKVADDLKDNVEGFLEANREPDMALLRYIKLNQYERLISNSAKFALCNGQNGTLEESTNADN